MPSVESKTTDRIAVIVIDHPPVNSLARPVRDGIVACLENASEDCDIDAIVITGSGRNFSAGADIREFDAPPEEPLLPDVVHALEASAKPVVAAMNGAALGGGLEIALGCHYRIAAEDATMGLPEVHLGLLPGAAGTQRLPRLAGVETALSMMLEGKRIGASEAKTMGLVDDVVAADALVAAAADFARERVGCPLRRIREFRIEDPGPALFDETRRRMAARTRGLVSPGKIVECVEAAVRLDYEAGCAVERDAFITCKASPQSGGLRHAFFAEREVAKVPGIDESTSVRDIEKIAVLGAGTMGAGIAYAALTSGFSVHLLDNSESGLARGRKTIEGYYDYGVSRGKLDADAAQAGLARLGAGTNYDAVADADLVIEAVFESMAVKEDVFSTLDDVCRPGAILATNTSTLDVDRIASTTRRPEDVVGLHFFSPAHIMRLLEVVRGEKTAEDVIATSLSLARRLGKVGVVVGNCFGFVGNRMLYSYGRENQLLLLEGAAPEYIDRTLYDWGMAMGPNAVGDLAGLDVGYKVRQERTDLPDDPRFYRVADMLAEQGRYGQKTGKGMYLYEENSRNPLPDPDVEAMIRAEAKRLGVERRSVPEEEIIERCIYGLVTEGARILEEGIALRSGDIDVIWTNGYGFPRYRGGPMHYADRIGLENVYRRVCEFAERFGREYWEPPALLRDLAKSGGSFGTYQGSGSS